MIPFEYDYMGDLSEGLIAVQKQGKWGYVDKTNKPVIPLNLNYEQVYDFHDGLAAVFGSQKNSDNMKYGYINKKGELVIPMNFVKTFYEDSDHIINFKKGIAVVNDHEGREFCINTKGEEVECPEGVGSNPNAYPENEVEASNIDIVDEPIDSNPESIANITDYLALKPNQHWTWDYLAAFPDVQDWRNQKPEKKDSIYVINAGLDENSYMIAYGTKKQPNFIVLGSGQGYMEDESLSGVYKLSDFFDLKDLTRIRSNCDVDDMFQQRFFKWQPNGAKPLYVVEAIILLNAGMTAQYGIAESLEEFFKPIYDDPFLEIRSVNYKNEDVVCTFEQ